VRLNDANIFSGVYRGSAGVPTLIVTVRPSYWSLPFSLTTYGCLLGKPGLTIGFLCIYVCWSKL
jgi:hypothetical protein